MIVAALVPVFYSRDNGVVVFRLGHVVFQPAVSTFFAIVEGKAFIVARTCLGTLLNIVDDEIRVIATRALLVVVKVEIIIGIAA